MKRRNTLGITKKGKLLTTQEVRKVIMKGFNLKSRRAYEKFYDIFRNKLRAYERYTGAKRQSVQEYLYKQAVTKMREGKKYRPSLKTQRIMRFTSVSSGKKGEQYFKSQRVLEKLAPDTRKSVLKQFGGLIAKNDQAKYLYDHIKDPRKLEKALTEYANMIHAPKTRGGNYRPPVSSGAYGESADSPKGLSTRTYHGESEWSRFANEYVDDEEEIPF